MTPWRRADPRVLTDLDLLQDHRVCHGLLAIERDPQGRSVLVLRHEMCRTAMALRWGLPAHGRDEHRTPVDLLEASERAQGVLLWYERHAYTTDRSPQENQVWFSRLMRHTPTPFTWSPGSTLASYLEGHR